MKKFILFLVLLIIGISANASHSASYWAKTYGGSGDELARSVQQTTDGGYILAGKTNSFGVLENSVLIILKTKLNPFTITMPM